MEKSIHERTLDRLHLCSEVIRLLHADLEIPENPDEKADLYLAVEHLGGLIVTLHRDVSDIVFPGEVPVED
jgi:hypothetical protein